MFSSLPRIWAGAGLEEKPFGYILQCAVLIRVLSSLDCLQISKETLWPAGFFTRHLCDWSSYCFFPVEILSFLEAGFQLGFGCFVNTTWNGGSKKCSCLSALFVFSAPPLLLWQVLGSGQGRGTLCRWVTSAALEMKHLCPAQILSLVWHIRPFILFFPEREDGGGLFSVKWRGALERCCQIQHGNSQYAAFDSQEILCFNESDREVKTLGHKETKWG